MSVPENVISWRQSLKSGCQFLSKAACIAGTFGALNLGQIGKKCHARGNGAVRRLKLSSDLRMHESQLDLVLDVLVGHDF